MRGITLRILVVVGMIATTLAVSNGSANAGIGTFTDDDGDIHEPSIEAIAKEGITKGCNPPASDRFCPGGHVTRGQMAAFLVRALGLTDRGSKDFTDDNDSVFEADIEKLAQEGITKGCNPPSNTRFCPDKKVTRGQLAAFLARALSLTDRGSKDFTDDNGSVFEADIEKLAQAGITKGCNPPSNTRFCPDNPVTRAQMATFLTRALGLDPIEVGPPPGLPAEDDAALVGRFHVRRTDTSPIEPYFVRNMGYWPRSFNSGQDINPVPGTENWQVDRVDDAGVYDGWDALSPANSWGFNSYRKDNTWMNFTLNRPARVGVVWRDDSPRPSWLQSGWSNGGTVQIDGRYAPVYEKSFPAGPVSLGTVEANGDSRTMYLILLAESDGTPTPTPPVPSGKQYPVPGKACPEWVHDRHTTVGPDGKTYNTWHPQWDPVYWCSFGHDHGSSPSLIPGAPMVPYGYVADKVPQDEPDMGFKEFTFQDLSSKHWVRFVIHAGTASGRRVCARLHTLYVQVYDNSGRELMNIGFKADYGAAVSTDGPVLTPSNCGYSMPALRNEVGDDRERSINVGADSNDYERWDSKDDTTQTRNLGFGAFEHSFDIRNPMSHCVNQTCNSVVKRDPEWQNATRRTMGMSSWQAPFTFSVARALGTGEFFTDPYGNGLVSSGAPNATRQFIDPAVQGVDFLMDSGTNRIECVATDPWTFDYQCFQLGDGDHIPPVPDMNIQFGIESN
ncbi:MAG: S-layer homology domain-containing protein [Acidimicrobiia bacterium]|nr:S-layer homology domain-containing protein [Acidimicrobiia bacterium]